MMILMQLIKTGSGVKTTSAVISAILVGSVAALKLCAVVDFI